MLLIAGYWVTIILIYSDILFFNFGFLSVSLPFNRIPSASHNLILKRNDSILQFHYNQ